MQKKKILILGSKGFYGKKLTLYLKTKGLKVYSDSRYKKLLKTKKSDFFLNKLLISIKPNIIINLVANTDVNFCETNRNEAKKSNVYFTKNLTKLVSKNKINTHLIHFSTDQVYGGEGTHSEKKTNPKNFYGLTKLKGEFFAKKIPYSILRLNFVGKSQKKKSLSDWIITNLKKGKKISVFKNIFFSPIHTSTLNRLILTIIKKPSIGIFNVGSKNKISKANFAYKLCKSLKFDVKQLKKTNYEKKTFGVERPLDMSLNVLKFEKKFKIKLPSVKSEILKLMKEYK